MTIVSVMLLTTCGSAVQGSGAHIRGGVGGETPPQLFKIVESRSQKMHVKYNKSVPEHAMYRLFTS